MRDKRRTQVIDLFPQVGQVTIDAQLSPRFDERLRVEEDIDWWIDIIRVAHPQVVEQIGYIRRVHDRPRSRSDDDLARALDSTLLLLKKNEAFFAKHPGAAAFRWRRIALFNERLGRRDDARAAFRRSAAIVGVPVDSWEIMRTYLPIPRWMRTRL